MLDAFTLWGVGMVVIG